jgi:hypothetical protein
LPTRCAIELLPGNWSTANRIPRSALRHQTQSQS